LSFRRNKITITPFIFIPLRLSIGVWGWRSPQLTRTTPPPPPALKHLKVENMPTIEFVVTKRVEDELGVKLDTEEIQLRLEAMVQTEQYAKEFGMTEDKEFKRLYKMVLHKLRWDKKEEKEK
jgi:hypothetical protein